VRLGLIRHFKVHHSFPSKLLLNRQDVIAWFEAYDSSLHLETRDVHLENIAWQQCYTSTMPRARQTARSIFKGEIIETDGLRELDILHTLPGGIRLPFLVWGAIVRIKSLRKSKDTAQFNQRISRFLDQILSSGKQDVLIVSHWFVMRTLRKELLKRGLRGQRFRYNEYATLYIFGS
jgi:broad specificity phosphatase PhoE